MNIAIIATKIKPVYFLYVNDALLEKLNNNITLHRTDIDSDYKADIAISEFLEDGNVWKSFPVSPSIPSNIFPVKRSVTNESVNINGNLFYNGTVDFFQYGQREEVDSMKGNLAPVPAAAPPGSTFFPEPTVFFANSFYLTKLLGITYDFEYVTIPLISSEFVNVDNKTVSIQSTNDKPCVTIKYDRINHTLDIDGVVVSGELLSTRLNKRDPGTFEINYVGTIDPYAKGGDSSTSVATGDFDGTSDPVNFPILPSIGATDTGLVTLYNPSLSEIRALASYMWTNPAFDISAWKKIFADPIDAILGLSIVPVAVPDGGQRHIAVGNLFTDVVMNVAAQQYIEVQCGALNVNEFWSSYLDYDPYTKAEIYLPYCGTHQLSVDDIMNKTVEVRYHVDILSGSCCAYVKCGDSVLYQFIGQCASSIPVASGDFSEIVSSAINAALAVGSVIATGGASAPFALPSYTANAVNILKEKIQKSGSLSGTGGMLAVQKPYLILTRPRQAHPANQNHYTGYPSFITENLSELSGYTEIEEIHLENVSATDSELNEIVTLLEGGVIF